MPKCLKTIYFRMPKNTFIKYKKTFICTGVNQSFSARLLRKTGCSLCGLRASLRHT